MSPKLTRRVYRMLLRHGLIPVSEAQRLEEMVGPPGVWKESRDFQIQFLRSRGLEPVHSLLEVGCGVLRGGIPLIRYLEAGKYVGLDIRPEAIAEARKLIDKESLGDKTPKVLQSSGFGSKELGERTFDFVWAFQVLYHLTDELLDVCLSAVRTRMDCSSRFFANINTESPSSEWKEFPFLRRPFDFYRGAAQRHDLTVEDLGQLRDHGYTNKVGGQYNHMLLFTRNG